MEELATTVEEIVSIADFDDDELLKAVSQHPVAAAIPFFQGLITYREVSNCFFSLFETISQNI